MNKEKPVMQHSWLCLSTLACRRFRTNCRPWIIIVGLLSVCLVLVGMAYAQSGGGYDLTWNTIDSGGGASIGGGYTLMGTLGRPDAGALSGSGYALAGGFWGGASIQYRIYLPIVLKSQE